MYGPIVALVALGAIGAWVTGPPGEFSGNALLWACYVPARGMGVLGGVIVGAMEAQNIGPKSRIAGEVPSAEASQRSKTRHMAGPD